MLSVIDIHWTPLWYTCRPTYVCHSKGYIIVLSYIHDHF